ncbi:hypothetical protein Tco_1335361 [Tanacetum coccineum]
MEAFKRRRSKLDYKIQQQSKGSSEGSGIVSEVPDEPKDISGSSSSSLYDSNEEIKDISSDVENKAEDGNDAEKQAREEEPVDVQARIEQTGGEKADVQDSAVQRTPLIDNVISMVTEKTTSTPTLPTTQAQVTSVSEFDSSLKFQQRLLKDKAMTKKALTKKYQQRTIEMLIIIDNLLLEIWIMRSLE